MNLTAEQITVGYGKQAILEKLSLELPTGAFTAIVGPNGSGKSTLLKVLARWLRPWDGRVCLDGQDLRNLHTIQIARSLAVLPQQPTAPPEMTVGELVASGRHPHLPRLGLLGPEDRRIVAETLAECQLQALADRRLGTLSGGQRQRAWLGMALAQQPRVLLLDEPLAALDINHQLEMMELLARLNKTRSLTIGIVMHDLNLAIRFCQRLVVMQAGQVVCEGVAEDVLTPEMMAQVFRVRAYIDRNPVTHHPRCHFERAIV